MTAETPDLVTVVGARPQFVKCALVSEAVRQAGLRELLVHTGQHYDDALSAVFFRELGIPAPDVNLEVGSGTHAQQTAAMLVRLEEVLLQHRPKLVLVYGDTNSTLAGALAAVKLGIPVAHIEAGLRSYNRTMPEEFNRVATDHWSEMLFCHNMAAAERLLSESVRGRIVVVGDVMREVLAKFKPRALAASAYPGQVGLERQLYAVLTVHRPVNSDRAALATIVDWCRNAPYPVLFPAHPRIQRDIADILAHSPASDRLHVLPPLSYLDMLATVAQARLVLTDSGGLQKEAFFLGVPCVTLRGETEWQETVEAGWNVLTGDRPTADLLRRAVKAVDGRVPSASHDATVEKLFGSSTPSCHIVYHIAEFLSGGGRGPMKNATSIQ